MFTGIIEEVGRVINKKSSSIVIKSKLKGIKVGDSIAVNGICLTISKISNNLLEFDVSPETYKKTSLNSLNYAAAVNLERSLKAGNNIGGHFLSGHIETTINILKIQQKNNSYEILFSMPEKLKNHIVSKGSVGIDGISLTVAKTRANSFSAAVIPHTYNNTVLKYKKAGDTVNFEPDILSKYMENIIQNREKQNKMTPEFLKKHGF
jgi:riboflavin synthase